MFLRKLSRLLNPSLELHGASTLRHFTTGLGYEALSHPGLDLAGKTFCVTGSTDGIGKMTALLLAQHSATVLVHGRSGIEHPARSKDTLTIPILLQ